MQGEEGKLVIINLYGQQKITFTWSSGAMTNNQVEVRIQVLGDSSHIIGQVRKARFDFIVCFEHIELYHNLQDCNTQVDATLIWW